MVEFEIVDSSVPEDSQCTVALGPDGTPWVAYKGLASQVVVAVRSGTGAAAWQRDRLSDGPPGSVEHVSLAVDSVGDPHVAYRDQESFLVYGVRKAGQWTFERVPTRLGLLEPGSATAFTLRLHSRPDTPELKDTPHLVFEDQLTGSIAYARKVQLPGTPTAKFRLVEAAKGAPGIFEMHHSSLTNREGSFAFAYVEDHTQSPGGPPRLHRVWGNLITDPMNAVFGERRLLVEGHFDVIRQMSITAGFSNLCTAYHDVTNKQLIVIQSVPGSQAKTVIADSLNPICPSAASRPDTRHRVAFDAEDGIKVARQVGGSGQFGEFTWETELIDPGAGTAACPSLVYGKEFNPSRAHLAYTAQTSIKYATWTE